jgi:hypothetical protein
MLAAGMPELNRLFFGDFNSGSAKATGANLQEEFQD